MGYIEQNLMTGEDIIYRAKLHWIKILSPWSVILTLFAIVVFLAGNATAGLFIIFLTALTLLPSFITRITSEFGVTNKRVLIKSGFIRRHSLEILLAKIEGIVVNQDVLGRILNYGTITITGAGGTKQPFPNIVAPLEFRKRVQERIAVG